MSVYCFNWIAFDALGFSAAITLAEPPHAQSISTGEREQIKQAMRAPPALNWPLASGR